MLSTHKKLSVAIISCIILLNCSKTESPEQKASVDLEIEDCANIVLKSIRGHNYGGGLPNCPPPAEVAEIQLKFETLIQTKGMLVEKFEVANIKCLFYLRLTPL